MSEEKVEQTAKSLQQLREPIIFCKALSRFCTGTSTRRHLAPLAPLTDRERFEKFVYKVALVCDHTAVKTITAVSVMEDDVNYWFVFACNQISEKEGEIVASHIESLLHQVARQDVSPQVMKDEILKSILLFSRKRIEKYIKSMISWANKLWNDADQRLPRDTALHEKLRNVVSCAYIDGLREYTDTEYLQSCLASLKAIRLFSKGLKSFPNGPFGSRESWGELKHCFSRLHAYEDAASCIMDTATWWPDLPKYFKVQHIPSSSEKSIPMGKSSCTADGIIRRMTSNQAELESLRAKVRSLPQSTLDKAIEEEAMKAKKPRGLTVHCEVLLEDWIEHVAETRGLRFFKGWKYIGASKPACRLCKYYFKAKSNGIALRPSHENLYTNWGFPEIYWPANSLQVKQWQDILNTFMRMVRGDVIRMLQEKTALSKRHDSNTYATLSVRSFPSQNILITHTQDRERTRMLVALPFRPSKALTNEEGVDQGGVKLR